jgi:hypothetical protein
MTPIRAPILHHIIDQSRIQIDPSKNPPAKYKDAFVCT